MTKNMEEQSLTDKLLDIKILVDKNENKKASLLLDMLIIEYEDVETEEFTT